MTLLVGVFRRERSLKEGKYLQGASCDVKDRQRLIDKDGGFYGWQFHQWAGGEGNSRVMNVRWREEAGQGEDEDAQLDESPGLKSLILGSPILCFVKTSAVNAM